MGAKVPGSFGAQIASKRAPNIAGNVGASLPGRLEPKCLEILERKFPAKEPPILRAMLGPARLADGRQSAWKFWGPGCHQNSAQYRGQFWGQPAWKMGTKVPGSFEARIASKNTLSAKGSLQRVDAAQMFYN